MATTFRADVVAGLLALLDGFKSSSGLIGYTFTVRPTHFARDGRVAYIGPRPESATHSEGVRTRTLSGLSVTFVDSLGDTAETEAGFDALVDAFADYLTARPHIIPGTIWNTWTVTDGQEVLGDEAILPNVTFTLPDLSISEGRV